MHSFVFVRSYLRVYHELLVVPLGVEDGVDGHVRVEHVPDAVGGEDKAAVAHGVNVVHVQVRLGRDDVLVQLSVVRPQVAQGAGHGEEGDLVDVRRPPVRWFVLSQGFRYSYSLIMEEIVYRVNLAVVGWVVFHFGHSTTCPALFGQMDVWQFAAGQNEVTSKSKSTQPRTQDPDHKVRPVKDQMCFWESRVAKHLLFLSSLIGPWGFPRGLYHTTRGTPDFSTTLPPELSMRRNSFVSSGLWSVVSRLERHLQRR